MSGTDPAGTEPDELDWRCYKHPDRDAGVRCRRCERALCPDCMITAPVGFQCRECVKGAPAVRSLRSLRSDPYVTWALLALNVAIFLPGMGSQAQTVDLGLLGRLVADGEWWRLVSSGFLHLNLMHLLFNMVGLWWLGGMLEPALGRARFAALYAGSLLSGSLGVLLLSPDTFTGGASGAVFGLMGGAVVYQRSRGVDPMQSGLGGLLLINLLFTFARPGISIGGHLGGLAGGALLGALLHATDDTRQRRLAGLAGAVLLGLAAAGASLWLASNPL